MKTFKQLMESNNYRVHIGFAERPEEPIHKVTGKADSPEHAAKLAHDHINKHFGVKWKTKVHKVEKI
jgi:hypothetical protein